MGRKRASAPGGKPRARASDAPAPPKPATASPPILGRAVAVGALAILVVAIYAPVRHFDFVNLDDPLYVAGNPDVAHGLTAQSLAWAFTTGLTANWHPVTWISLLLDVSLFGVNAPAHHVVNVLFHLANTLLLFWLLVRATGATWPSAFVAALFGVHPLHVESVAWISERKDVLSTFFMCLAMLAYVEYARTPMTSRRPEGRRLLLYVAVAVALTLGLMAKPMVVTLPIVLLLFDIWPLGRLRVAPLDVPALKSLVVEKLPLVAVVVVCSIVTFFVQREGGAVIALETLPFSGRFMNAVLSTLWYLEKAFWPSGLAMLYPFRRLFSIGEVAGAIALLTVISAVVVSQRRARPYLLAGWLWFLVTLVPIIGLVQVGPQAMADRYTYTPLVGIFIMVAWGASELVTRWSLPRVVTAAAGAAIVLALSVTAHAQVGYWANSLVAWQRAVDVTENNFVAENSLAGLLAEQGRTADATAHLQKAVAANGSAAEGHINLGLSLASAGRLDEAIAELKTAVQLAPAAIEPHDQLGRLLMMASRPAEAVTEYRELIRLEPKVADAHVSLALALAGVGQIDEAARELHEALRLDPANADAAQALKAIGK